MNLPAPELLRSYETLGIVGILLFVLIVLGGIGTAAAVWLGHNATKFVSSFASEHLDEMKKQSYTMLRIEMKQDELKTAQEGWNSFLQCWMPSCPLKAWKNEQPTPHHETNLAVQNNPVQPPAGVAGVFPAGASVGRRE